MADNSDYQQLPPRITPDQWVTEKPVDPVPGSISAAPDDATQDREFFLRWGAAGG